MQMLAKLPVRRWWYLMPIIFITYSLAYLDRANYGFAAAAGIESDLGITKGTASLIGALFFLGYFFFQVPGAIYAVKTQRAKNDFLQSYFMGILRGGDRVRQQIFRC
ncbi:2-ketogluconate transporter [Klebsiella oxytoca]|nr:2-ketogluconate transporter [Klebsiella oxytoca]